MCMLVGSYHNSLKSLHWCWLNLVSTRSSFFAEERFRKLEKRWPQLTTSAMSTCNMANCLSKFPDYIDLYRSTSKTAYHKISSSRISFSRLINFHGTWLQEDFNWELSLYGIGLYEYCALCSWVSMGLLTWLSCRSKCSNFQCVWKLIHVEVERSEKHSISFRI